ncbi:uncharacterized protein LOC131604461 [Vicia villosa]|uniref:uncharacterized protein LOC131604461 n=1 Tax=Vicia villosa TaxID=3911 RepID=UPI00273AAB38|nr:uncharacterized protein LOC131604461 [Vicia villosa]
MQTEAWESACANGRYVTGAMYKEVNGSRPNVSWKNLLRGNWARPRAMFVLWLACHNRLNKKDRVERYGIVTDGKCSFCDANETCDHLLFQCKVTGGIWKQMLEWQREDHTPQNWEAELKWILMAGKGKSQRAKLMRLCAAETVYYIWMARNMRVFQQEHGPELNMLDIVEVIKERLTLDNKLRTYCSTL